MMFHFDYKNSKYSFNANAFAVKWWKNACRERPECVYLLM